MIFDYLLIEKLFTDAEFKSDLGFEELVNAIEVMQSYERMGDMTNAILKRHDEYFGWYLTCFNFDDYIDDDLVSVSRIITLYYILCNTGTFSKINEMKSLTIRTTLYLYLRILKHHGLMNYYLEDLLGDFEFHKAKDSGFLIKCIEDISTANGVITTDMFGIEGHNVNTTMLNLALLNASSEHLGNHKKVVEYILDNEKFVSWLQERSHSSIKEAYSNNQKEYKYMLSVLEVM